MKRKRMLCLTLLLMFCLLRVSPAAASPVTTVEIGTAEDLVALFALGAFDGQAVLTADIDLTGITLPALTLSGTLDAQGHTLSGLTLTERPGGEFGLFRSITETGVVQNLRLDPIYVDITPQRTNLYIGSLAAKVSGSVNNCAVSGRITVHGANAWQMFRIGGLVGALTGGSLTDCEAQVEVSFDGAGVCSIGGLCGLTAQEAVFTESAVSGHIRANTSGKLLACGVSGVLDAASAVDCAFDGNLSLTGAEVLAGGIIDGWDALVEMNGCTVTGGIAVDAVQGNGLIRSLRQATASDTYATLSLNAGEGSAYGVSGGSDAMNFGAITADGIQVSAAGLSDVSGGENHGTVTVSASQNGNAYGLLHCGASKNYATVSMRSNGGAKGNAAGAYASLDGCVNFAAVRAVGDDNAVSSWGIAADTTGSKASQCVNSGAVSAETTGSGTASAGGLANCTGSVNRGDITVISHAATADGVGLSGCENSLNTGNITVTAYRSANGTGVRASDSQSAAVSVNRGTVSVYSEDGSATAAGIDAGTNGLNQGIVKAVGNSAVASGATGNGARNEGAVFAESDRSNASATGASGERAVNVGSVTVLAAQRAFGYGVSSGNGAYNYGGVWVKTMGADASAVGAASDYGYNGGAVEVNAAAGNATGVGAKGASVINQGTVTVTATGDGSALGADGVTAVNFAEVQTDASGTAKAVGVGGDGSYNGAAVSAVSAGKNAQALGHSHTSGNSGGEVFAKTTGEGEAVAKYSVTAVTEYAEIKMEAANGVSRYGGHSKAESDAKAGNPPQQTGRQVWEQHPDAAAFQGSGTLTVDMGLWRNDGQTPVRVIVSSDSVVTLHVALCYQLEQAGTIDPMEEVRLTLTAPTGFSFAPDTLRLSAERTVDSIAPGETVGLDIPLYPIAGIEIRGDVTLNYFLAGIRSSVKLANAAAEPANAKTTQATLSPMAA